MAARSTSIRLDRRPADEAAKALGVKPRVGAGRRIALREIVKLKRFRHLMNKNRGKLFFAGLDE
jgi:hypothetical protein